MAFIIPQPETGLQALSGALQFALPGLVQGAQSRANQQFAIGQGLGNVPFGTSPQLLQALLSKQGVGGAFTLTPGGQRFDPQGNVIASVPSETQQDPFTLSPGGQRFDAQGNVIASLPPSPRAPRAPTSFESTQKQIDVLSAKKRAGTATETDKARLKQLLGIKPLLPSQQISQKKLDEINRLQGKIDAGTATDKEKAKLNKLLIGVPLVEIGFGKPAAAAERTAIAETRASLDALGNLKTLFDSAQTRTGPVVGRVDPFKGLAGLTTDEQESFMAATSAFKNAVIKQITGAQMSEPEAKRIMKQIPDITDPPTRWEAKWQQTKKNLQFLQKRRTEVLRQSGLRVPEEAGQLEIQAPLGLNAAEEAEFQALINKAGQ